MWRREGSGRRTGHASHMPPTVQQGPLTRVGMRVHRGTVVLVKMVRWHAPSQRERQRRGMWMMDLDGLYLTKASEQGRKHRHARCPSQKFKDVGLSQARRECCAAEVRYGHKVGSKRMVPRALSIACSNHCPLAQGVPQGVNEGADTVRVCSTLSVPLPLFAHDRGEGYCQCDSFSRDGDGLARTCQSYLAFVAAPSTRFSPQTQCPTLPLAE